MKQKIIAEVNRGTGPLHMLSILENKNIQNPSSSYRNSKLLQTHRLLNKPFYKSPV